LLATRGRPKRLANGVRDLLFAKRRAHRQKPDEQYERCQALYAEPYLKLFARQAWPGWTAWGNQTDKFTRELKHLPSAPDSSRTNVSSSLPPSTFCGRWNPQNSLHRSLNDLRIGTVRKL
jgi:hypothetical protein